MVLASGWVWWKQATAGKVSVSVLWTKRNCNDGLAGAGSCGRSWIGEWPGQLTYVERNSSFKIYKPQVQGTSLCTWGVIRREL